MTMAGSSRRILGMIMAGGEGTRLFPLTRDRAKPAVPFGGKYRLIDFVLSNFVNSGIFSIYVMVQFKSQSLIEHLAAGWKFGGLIAEHFISPVPAQMQRGQAWSRLLGQCFPQALRLSARPEDPHADTIGIGFGPVPEPTEAWLTPWQGVALLAPEGWRLLPRSEAEALGARLIRRGRRPSHYSLLDEAAEAQP